MNSLKPKATALMFCTSVLGALLGSVSALMAAYPKCAEWSPTSTWLKGFILVGAGLLLIIGGWKIRIHLIQPPSLAQSFFVSVAASFLVMFYGICSLVWVF
jgi:drug/metabolite transporter (DMT)-like permease